MKTHTIEIPEGKMIDKITFKDIPVLPKDFLDLEVVRGYWVDSSSDIRQLNTDIIDDSTKNVFVKPDEAKASIAFAQLSQLKKVYNGDWTPDWEKYNEPKYCIEFFQEADELIINTNYKTRKFLAFKTHSLAIEFFENFKSLIVQTRPLV